MSIPKFESLKLGPGNINNPSGESQFWPVSGVPSPSLGKNGDVAINTSSPFGVYQKVGGTWEVVGSLLIPVNLSLVDGQASPVTAFTYSAAVFPMAMLTYTIKRGTDDTQKRFGSVIILSDAVSNTLAPPTEERVEFGADVGVTLTYSVVGGLVTVKYTSQTQGTLITLGYVLSGWA